ncbi:MAG: DUF1028 domain-containing protein [Limnochordaceae bacterium]|nr:DUF1028 domain-containing protein [Limnochordaceae bacterium]
MQAPVATFSIVAADPGTGSLGVAVASKFLAVGAVVPWAKAGVGAIATQAWANTSYGPAGLELLAAGHDVASVARQLTASDDGREHRQFGIVDAQGHAFAYTGAQCLEWAGDVTGPYFSCQGNILAGPQVVEAMAEAFQSSGGRDLAARLVAALSAGQRAGGDRRGRQSAAILVVREKGGYGGYTDRYMDLRVDDHPDPVAELERLVRLFRLYFEKEERPQHVALEGAVLLEAQQALVQLGWLGQATGRLDDATREALRQFHAVENFEEREAPPGLIDRVVLEFLKEKAATARAGQA